MSLVLVTSPTGGDGRSTVALELATIWAAAGLKIALVETGSTHLAHRLGLKGSAALHQEAPNLILGQINENLTFRSFGDCDRESAFRQALEAERLIETEVQSSLTIVDCPTLGHDEVLELSRTAENALILYLVPAAPLAVSLIDLDNAQERDIAREDGKRAWSAEIVYALNLVDPRRSLCRDMEALVKFKLGDALISTLHFDAAVPEAEGLAKAVGVHSPQSQFALDIAELADSVRTIVEIEQREGRMGPPPAAYLGGMAEDAPIARPARIDGGF